MLWTEPDDDFSVSIPIGGEHFKPDANYSIKVGVFLVCIICFVSDRN